MNQYEKTTFPKKELPIRLAMLGMIPGNGHPYSWSAILNGYNEAELEKCPYPVIPQYMAQQGEASDGLDLAEVTHIWTDDPDDAPKVAAAARIPNILPRPEEAIGKVDAVIISTDDGVDHVRRAQPFIEAGLPIFIDKPLATNLKDLNWFLDKAGAGHFIMSCSGLRYSPELQVFENQIAEAGKIRWILSAGIKKWETYGIHALEPVYLLLGPGFTSIRVESGKGSLLALLEHKAGVLVTVPILEDAYELFGFIQVFATRDIFTTILKNTYRAFKCQLESFLFSMWSKNSEIPFLETVELMSMLIAGRISMAEKNRRVELSEIYSRINGLP